MVGAAKLIALSFLSMGVVGGQPTSINAVTAIGRTFVMASPSRAPGYPIEGARYHSGQEFSRLRVSSPNRELEHGASWYR